MNFLNMVFEKAMDEMTAEEWRTLEMKLLLDTKLIYNIAIKTQLSVAKEIVVLEANLMVIHHYDNWLYIPQT